MQTINKYYFIIIVFSLSLIACGGGGGGANTNADTAPATAAALVLAFDIKTFDFTWTDVADATHYKLLENPDGASGFTQIGGDIAQGTQSYHHGVALYNRVNASYMLQSCNAVGCTDSTAVNVTGNLLDGIGFFKASNSDSNDFFGSVVTLNDDGTTLAIGAPGEDSATAGINGNETDNTAGDSGAVYVFVKATNGWRQQAYIKASNAQAGDMFGTSLGLSADGHTLAVGAVFEDSATTGINSTPDESAGNAGAVYVFTRQGDSWSEQAYIKAHNTDASDAFGYALSLSDDGDTLAVGAVWEDNSFSGIDPLFNEDASTSGAVYVFTRSGADWIQEAYIKASNPEATDNFGASLSLSENGNTLAVGAFFEDGGTNGIGGDDTDNTAGNAGAVYVFERDLSGWSQQAYIKASNSDAEDRFGIATSLSNDGNTLAVGANSEDSFTRGINGNELDNTTADSGAVYLFVRNGATWSQQAYIKSANSDAGDRFGRAVSLSSDGDTLAVSANEENGDNLGLNSTVNENVADTGALYLYMRSGTDWTEQSYIKASNLTSNLGASIGFSASAAISISGDSETLAAGSLLESSSDTGISNSPSNDAGKTNAGAVYLY